MRGRHPITIKRKERLVNRQNTTQSIRAVGQKIIPNKITSTSMKIPQSHVQAVAARRCRSLPGPYRFPASPRRLNAGVPRDALLDANFGIRSGILLPELLGEPDENSFGTPDVAEPIRVFILDHCADELRAAFAEPGERSVDVLHGEHDA